MQKTEIAQRPRGFIVENYVFGQDGGLKDTDSFLEKGIIDSTGVLELVAYLQESFAINVEDEELTPDNLDSISNVTAYLVRKLNLCPGPAAPDAGQHLVERRS
jgi:acyl carrier protein